MNIDRLVEELEKEAQGLRVIEKAIESLFEDRGAWRNHPEGEEKTSALKAIDAAIAAERLKKRNAEVVIRSKDWILDLLDDRS